MCGRYSLKRSDFNSYEEWMEYRKKQYDEVHSNPIYNAAPTMSMPVIRPTDTGLTVDWMRWGLLQPWNQSPSDAFKTFNARRDGLTEKPTWKKSLAARRCLVIADGFYEWKQEGKTRQPYRVVLRSGDQFAMAGLWNPWTNPVTGEFFHTFAIITTEANRMMQPLHDRMPVILPDDSHNPWLDPSIVDPTDLLPLLTQYPGDALRFYRVTTAIGKMTYQEPDAVLPVDSLF